MAQVSNGGAGARGSSGFGGDNGNGGGRTENTGSGEMSYGRPGNWSRGEDRRSLAEQAATSTRGGSELSGMERWGTLLGGGLLVRWGLRHGGVTGLIGVAAGGLLAWAGANGRMPAATANLGRNREEERIADQRGWSSAAATSTTITIGRPAEELYRFWRDFSNLSQVMEHVEEIRVIDDRRSRWTVRAPAGQSVSWEARVTEDQPNRRIAWESAPGADVRNFGWVEFRPSPTGDGTEVKAMIVYEPPAGQIGRLIAKLFLEEPGVQMRDDLQSFKQLMETGGLGDDRGRPKPRSTGGSAATPSPSSAAGGTTSATATGGPSGGGKAGLAGAASPTWAEGGTSGAGTTGGSPGGKGATGTGTIGGGAGKDPGSLSDEGTGGTGGGGKLPM